MVAAGIIRPLFECYGHCRHFSPPPSHCDRACAGRICTGPRESIMKKLLFSAAIMMIVTSPALAAGLGIGDRKVGPEIEHVVQVHIRKKRRDHRTLPSARVTDREDSVFQHARLKPFWIRW